jgi:hypothetical protein
VQHVINYSYLHKDKKNKNSWNVLEMQDTSSFYMYLKHIKTQRSLEKKTLFDSIQNRNQSPKSILIGWGE